MQIDYLITRPTSDARTDKETGHHLVKASRTIECMNLAFRKGQILQTGDKSRVYKKHSKGGKTLRSRG